jgi:peptidoglycan hydrolase-like protein with peptidoglycan-binding domain
MTARVRRRRPLRAAVLAGAALLTLGAAGAAAVGFGGRSDGSAPQPGALPAATAPITRQTLVESATVQGQLDYGTSTPIQLTGAGGTVTWLPAQGATIRRGQTVVRVDEHPVPLLYGSLPTYRPLADGVEGPDVAQFERNLRDLGYTGFTVDDRYSSSTASAVKRWQQELGLAETGTVQPGQVVYATGAIRVADLTARIGSPPSGPLLSYTGTGKVVTVNAPATDVAWARKGAKVTVALPDAKEVPGVVASVGGLVTSPTDNGGPPQDPTVPVTVTIANQSALRAYDRAPVDVRYTASERADVLTVPIAALLALAEGGYGVELVDRGTSRVVPVETGLFAAGRVEVRGPDLADGQEVGVPR